LLGLNTLKTTFKDACIFWPDLWPKSQYLGSASYYRKYEKLPNIGIYVWYRKKGFLEKVCSQIGLCFCPTLYVETVKKLECNRYVRLTFQTGVHWCRRSRVRFTALRMIFMFAFLFCCCCDFSFFQKDIIYMTYWNSFLQC